MLLYMTFPEVLGLGVGVVIVVTVLANSVHTIPVGKEGVLARAARFERTLEP